MKNSHNIIGISCGIFQDELKKLYESQQINVKFSYLNSMLHLKPELLEEKLDNEISKYPENTGILLIYGDCHARMDKYDLNKNIEKIKGVNCCEIILGKKKYRQLRKEGVFLLLPEWSKRFKNIFRDKFGFNSENAKDFMRDMHKKIIYLDTGVISIPYDYFNEILDYCGLKPEVVSIELNILKDRINNSYKKLVARLDGKN